MSVQFARRLDVIQPSATVGIAQKARELQSRGVDVLSFSLGEPDFATPDHIVRATDDALAHGATKYTATGGIAELRKAIAERSAARRGGHKHSPAEVLVSVGAKHALFNLSLVLFEAGDEVIIPAPYWVSYPEQVRLAGATDVLLETKASDGYKLQPAALEQAMSPRTKAVILCSPSNPTGAAYGESELEALADVLRKHRCYIIVDEIYGELVYGGFKQVSLLEVAPDLRDRLIIVDGVSKTYAMTGFRIGWTLAPAPVIAACDMIQGQSTTNPTTAAQWATIAALTGPQDCVTVMRNAFEARRDELIPAIRGIQGLRATLPEGAFYAFVDASDLIGKTTPAGKRCDDDVALVSYLLEEARVAVVPGSAFGAPGCFRMSYACSTETIRSGVARIAEAVAKLR